MEFNGLLHLISIHPLWKTLNEYPGGQRRIFMKGRGVFEANLIVFRGESITNYGALEDASPLLGDFPFILSNPPDFGSKFTAIPLFLYLVPLF